MPFKTPKPYAYKSKYAIKACWWIWRNKQYNQSVSLNLRRWNNCWYVEDGSVDWVK